MVATVWKEQMRRGQSVVSLGNDNIKDLLSVTGDHLSCGVDWKECSGGQGYEEKPLSCYGSYRGQGWGRCCLGSMARLMPGEHGT